MSAVKERFVYYGHPLFEEDLEKAKQLVLSVVNVSEAADINDVLEIHHAMLALRDSDSDLSLAYKTINTFFNGITDASLASFGDIEMNYIESFWLLLEQTDAFKRLSPEELVAFMDAIGTPLYIFCQHKKLVSYCDQELADCMRGSSQTAELLISSFLERTRSARQCFLPKSLSVQDYAKLIEDYIESAHPHPGKLELIANSTPSKEFVLSDNLRLKAKRRSASFWEARTGEGWTAHTFKQGVEIGFAENPEEVPVEPSEDGTRRYVYDLTWIQNNLDYPTLLNNFIYLFEYVDLRYRSTISSVPSRLGTFERVLGVKGKRDYEHGADFLYRRMKSTAEMVGYRDILSGFGINIEDLVTWFFTSYLNDEFGISGFRVDFLNPDESAYHKNVQLVSQIESVFKQYKCYVENGAVDQELMRIASAAPAVGDVPSLVEKKYGYPTSSESNLVTEQNLLFSDQSPLVYIKAFSEQTASFAQCVMRNRVKTTDIHEAFQEQLLWLKERGSIDIDDDNLISLNIPRANTLFELYDTGVLCLSYERGNEVISELISSGELVGESSLFSKLEQDYYCFVMNKSRFDNGYDLRNKYAHGNLVVETEASNDYIELLKILVLTVLKINEEFCLANPEAEVRIHV